MDSSDPSAYKDKGFALLGAGKLQKALEAYEQAHRLAPKDPIALQRIAEILVKLDRPGDALAHYTSLALLFADSGFALKAIAVCKLILALAPSHTETQHLLADLHAKQRGQAPAVDTLSNRRRVSDNAVAADRLPTIALFSDLPKEAFVALVGQLEAKRVPAGQTIINEGDAASAMYILVEGDVMVARGESGWKKPLLRMQAGDFFGEMAILTDAPRLASVIAQTDCTVLELSRPMLQALYGPHPAIEAGIKHICKSRLLANLLRASDLFGPLDEAQRSALIAAFAPITVSPGTKLIVQNQPATGFFVLLRGRCAAYSIDKTDRRSDYPALTEGHVFGEISLILGKPPTATVEALSPCVLLRLDAEAFRRLILGNAKARDVVLKLAEERIRRSASLKQLPSYLDGAVH